MILLELTQDVIRTLFVCQTELIVYLMYFLKYINTIYLMEVTIIFFSNANNSIL